MSITLLTEQTDPPIDGDFTLGMAIQRASETPQLSILTDWESVLSAPLAKEGAFIRHAGNTYQVKTADEAISGSPAAGINYIIASDSGGVITLAWSVDISLYNYNPAYGGIYNDDGDQVLADICYLDGTDYLRGRGLGQDFNTYYLANGFYDLDVSNDLAVSNDLTVSNNLKIDGELLPTETRTDSTVYPASSTPYIIPRGVYTMVAMESSKEYPIQAYINGGWKTLETITTGVAVQVISDGVNYRINNPYAASSWGIKMGKH